MLIQAGALYHDVGKAANPAFFIENQPPGFENPHDKLDPQESARLIIAHVSDGLKLARQHRPPAQDSRFYFRTSWDEHNSLPIFQCSKVCRRKRGTGRSRTFPLSRTAPPKPRDRVLMLADACEAHVRAERPTEDDLLRDLIKSVVSDRIRAGS